VHIIGLDDIGYTEENNNKIIKIMQLTDMHYGETESKDTKND